MNNQKLLLIIKREKTLLPLNILIYNKIFEAF
jgi:hypothetical protein